ncbi:hypothetical protein [Gemmatimonas sp.]|uniref:hypothetical protein n=1 Tax=Gemmatimonas sp. TaxID=1962908 RepID=UPI0033427D84
MSTPTTLPKTLHPDASGFIRLDRPTCFAQILLNLHEERPTKFEVLMSRLSFSEQSVRGSLAILCEHGFTARVERGSYVRRWAPIPGVS